MFQLCLQGVYTSGIVARTRVKDRDRAIVLFLAGYVAAFRSRHPGRMLRMLRRLQGMVRD